MRRNTEMLVFLCLCCSKHDKNILNYLRLLRCNDASPGPMKVHDQSGNFLECSDFPRLIMGRWPYFPDTNLICFDFFKTAASVVSSHGPTSATREHEKRILESILPPDLRHLVRGGSSGTLQVKIIIGDLD